LCRRLMSFGGAQHRLKAQLSLGRWGSWRRLVLPVQLFLFFFVTSP
jgi:hypothetical protein